MFSANESTEFIFMVVYRLQEINHMFMLVLKNYNNDVNANKETLLCMKNSNSRYKVTVKISLHFKTQNNIELFPRLENNVNSGLKCTGRRGKQPCNIFIIVNL